MKANQKENDSVTVANAYAPTPRAENEQVNNFMMISKEQWLI